jgi:hypothetical protein
MRPNYRGSPNRLRSDPEPLRRGRNARCGHPPRRTAGSVGTVRLGFTVRGHAGAVEVNVVPNDDPAAFGTLAERSGFPLCTATVSCGGRGYTAVLGWIQLVRSSDGASGGTEFELDPYEPLGRLPHPFCWFGIAPTLFDAPSRPTRAPLEWAAHSFLAFIGRPREARAILGFSWGFAVRGGQVSIVRPRSLSSADWDRHLALLRREHPTWRFAPGYHER